MVRITILYPNTQGSKFDMEYYVKRHMPRSIELLSKHPGFRSVSVEKGIAGGAPGAPAAFTAVCHYEFDTVESFLAAFMPNAPELQGDIANYTDVTPTIQINEILISK